MSTLAIVVIAVVAVLLALAVGGAVANARRQPDPGDREAALAEANRALAAAHATDKGWEPVALQATARREFEQRRPGVAVREQALVQVLDRPGTDEDHAVFRFVTDHGETLLTLGRSGGEWVTERID